MAKAINLLGTVFGRLTVVGRGGGMYARPSWVCQCTCGNQVEVGRGNLRSGSTTSCGCYSLELFIENATTHGLSKTGAYSSWSKMMSRCYDPTHPYYNKYGGAGVHVDTRWHSFINFYSDMGDRPDGCTLDRKSNKLGYCSANCRWATRVEQANNRQSNHTVLYRGRRYTLANLARRTGIEQATLRKRLERMSVDRAVTTKLYER